jgi:hypothetical protein
MERTANGDNVARVAWFQNPISAVKIQKKASVAGEPSSPEDFFTRVHVSIQSTSSTNGEQMIVDTNQQTCNTAVHRLITIAMCVERCIGWSSTTFSAENRLFHL